MYRNVQRKKEREVVPNMFNCEPLLGEFIEHSAQPFVIWYQDGSLKVANRAFSALVGYPEEELRTLDWYNDLTPPEWKETEVKALTELCSTKEPARYEKEYLRKDGTRIPVELLAHLARDESGSGHCYYAFVQDITEHKRAEEALRISEERFRQVSENAQEWIWEVDDKGLYTYASPAVEKILGYLPDEIAGRKHFYDLFLPEIKERLAEEDFAVFASKAFFRGFENANLHKNGSTVFLETSGSPMLDREGNLLGYRGLDIDVTTRKHAESALRESEQRFRQLAENLDQVFWFIQFDPERVLYVSPSFERIWGMAVDDIYQNPKLWVESIHPEDRAGTLKQVEVLIKGAEHEEKGGRGADKYDVEYRIIKKGGEVRWIHEYGTNCYDQKGHLILISGIAEDITERKDAVDALKQMKEELAMRVVERTKDLDDINKKLKGELSERQLIEKALKIRERELRERSKTLEDANKALEVVLKRIEKDKDDLEKNLLSNMRILIGPYIDKLKKTSMSPQQKAYLSVLEVNLNDVVSPFSQKLSSKFLALTPREIRVAALVKEGKTSKEISGIMNISKGTVDFHRDHIRMKLGLKNKNGNLRSFLLSIN